MKQNTRPIRSDPRFYDEIAKIQQNLVNLGKTKISRPTSPAKITLAITRHKLFPKIKEDIIREFKWE